MKLWHRIVAALAGIAGMLTAVEVPALLTFGVLVALAAVVFLLITGMRS